MGQEESFRSSALTLCTKETPTLMETCTVLRTMMMGQEHSEPVLMLDLLGHLLELRCLLPSKELLMEDLTFLILRRGSLDTTVRANPSTLMSTGPNIFGQHVADYMRNLSEEDEE